MNSTFQSERIGRSATTGAIQSDSDAILAMFRAETDAWLRRDFDALASCWVQSPQTRRLHAFVSIGVRVDVGWEAIADHIRRVMARHPKSKAFEGRVRWENVNVVVDGNLGWVTYDQIGLEDETDMKRLLKVVQRVDGAWKIACLSVMQSVAEQASWPLIQVDARSRILWMNQHARDRIREHAGLAISAGRLVARQRSRRRELRKILGLAFSELEGQVPLNVSAKQDWCVHLSEDDLALPLFCWVQLEDGKVMVSFEHAEAVDRRVAEAQAVYRLSPGQARLAHLIIDGHDLTSASRLMGVSVNTVRTQLQRAYDKTGVRNQSALVRRLLSASPPSR